MKLSSSDGTLLCSGDVEYWWDDDGLDTNPTYWADAVGVDLEVTPDILDDNFYVTGKALQRHWFYYFDGNNYVWDSEEFNNFFTAKYDGDCNLPWRDEYGNYEDEDQPHELLINSDGHIFVTGPSGSELATIQYLPNGSRAGVYRYSQNDFAGFHIDGENAYVIELDQYGPP